MGLLVLVVVRDVALLVLAVVRDVALPVLAVALAAVCPFGGSSASESSTVAADLTAFLGRCEADDCFATAGRLAHRTVHGGFDDPVPDSERS